MKTVITGNFAVAEAVNAARAQVIAAYPITPQTGIVERLAELCSEGRLVAEYVKVESEHSALATLVGAASVGARTFSATSSHGLAYMHEMLHWASGARLPIVLANVNRALGPGWNIWADQTDSLSQRDTGWLQVYCASSQEAHDSVLIAYRVAEQIMLPVMIVLEAFVLSHTSEIVDLCEPPLADQYLPPPRFKRYLDLQDPRYVGQVMRPRHFQLHRQAMQQAMDEAFTVWPRAEAEFKNIFGRRYGIIEGYRAQDADLVVVSSGTISSTAQVVVDQCRQAGGKVGLLRLRLFRPFPGKLLRRALRRAAKVVVLDRNISIGRGGIFAEEIRAAMSEGNHENQPQVFGYVLGLGGMDVTPEHITQAIAHAQSRKVCQEPVYWIGT